MDSLPDAIRALHDEAFYPGSMVKRLWQEVPRSEPREFWTTTELSERVAMSAEWWADAAREGKVPGAYQAGKNGPWWLPYHAARAHLTRAQHRPRGRGSRGPYRKAS